jgi:hypothetical protein
VVLRVTADLINVHLTTVNPLLETLSEYIVFGDLFRDSLFLLPILKVAEDCSFLEGQHVTDFGRSVPTIKKLEGDYLLAIDIHAVAPV